MEPSPKVMKALRSRLSASELRAFTALFAVRVTGQHVANVVTEWMANTAGSPARFQILIRVWASEGEGLAHKDLVTDLGVTRATISGLMAGLERDGLVTSRPDADDRRSMLAFLTKNGNDVVERAIAENKVRMRSAFDALTATELATLISLLQRVKENFHSEIPPEAPVLGRKPIRFCQ
jgi:DNA-binding MarR family transcriptional regulator